MPTGADYQANRTLSGFAIRYQNSAYIADLVSPVCEVESKSGFYYSFGETDDFDEYETNASEEGAVSESKGKRQRNQYDTTPFSHKEFVSAEAEEEGNLINLPEIDLAVNRVTDVVLRKREIAVANKLTNTANYPAGFRLAVVNKWGTATMKQILDVINDAKDVLVEDSGPLQLTCGRVVARALCTNANLIAAVTPTKAVGQLKLEQLAELLEVDRIVVGKAKKTTKVKNKTTKSFIWGDFAILNYVNPKPSWIGTTGHNVSFRRKLKGLSMRTYVLPNMERGSDGGTEIKVSMIEDYAKIVNDAAGYLFSACTA
jgi:hypothetical protein